MQSRSHSCNPISHNYSPIAMAPDWSDLDKTSNSFMHQPILSCSPEPTFSSGASLSSSSRSWVHSVVSNFPLFWLYYYPRLNIYCRPIRQSTHHSDSDMITHHLSVTITLMQDENLVTDNKSLFSCGVASWS